VFGNVHEFILLHTEKASWLSSTNITLCIFLLYRKCILSFLFTLSVFFTYSHTRHTQNFLVVPFSFCFKQFGIIIVLVFCLPFSLHHSCKSHVVVSKGTLSLSPFRSMHLLSYVIALCKFPFPHFSQNTSSSPFPFNLLSPHVTLLLKQHSTQTRMQIMAISTINMFPF